LIKDSKQIELKTKTKEEEADNMSVNYSFKLGFGFKLTTDNFTKKHYKKVSHKETRYDINTGEKYEFNVVDQNAYDDYYFNGTWGPFSQEDLDIEKVLGKTAFVYWSFSCTGDDEDCCFITVQSDNRKMIDEGRVDVSWEELTMEDLIPISEQLNSFKKKLEEHGCINLDKATNKFTCCSRIG
jgi:hypothetical protein